MASMTALLMVVYALGVHRLGGPALQAQNKQTGSPAKQPKLSLPPPADRVLKADEAEEMVRLILVALSRDPKNPWLGWDKRREAIRALGMKLGHKAVIPVLLKLIDDSSDFVEDKSEAAYALGFIPDKSVFLLLVDIAEKYSDDEVRFKASEKLYRLSGYLPKAPSKRPATAAEADRLAAQAYREWWGKNKDTYDPRKAVFRMSMWAH